MSINCWKADVLNRLTEFQFIGVLLKVEVLCDEDPLVHKLLGDSHPYVEQTISSPDSAQLRYGAFFR